MKQDLVIGRQDRVSGLVAWATIMKRRPLEDRFWDKVVRRGPDECWPWSGATSSNGRGTISLDNGKITSAARVAFLATHGHWPIVACHSCDNPGCVNPAHIWSGTYSENIQDSIRKGRHYNSALTHCKHGHEFSPDNTRIQGGRRICKTCDRTRQRKYNAERKAYA
jgi:hypothetical protein